MGLTRRLERQRAEVDRRIEDDATMLKELATAAAYGASASFGRDVYRSTKNGNPVIWLGLAAFMSIAGFKMIASGGEQEGEGLGFLSTIGAIFLILAGILIFDVLAVLFMGYTGLAAYYAGGSMKTFAEIVLAVTFIYVAVSCLVGSTWGKGERTKKERVWAIEAHNAQFLDENGFQDVGLGDEIIEDADGNRLKIKEQQDDRILFLVVGRRNVRAAIILDEEGRMTDYTGAVKL